MNAKTRTYAIPIRAMTTSARLDVERQRGVVAARGGISIEMII
jgi:hypothetical protein